MLDFCDPLSVIGVVHCRGYKHGTKSAPYVWTHCYVCLRLWDGIDPIRSHPRSVEWRKQIRTLLTVLTNIRSTTMNSSHCNQSRSVKNRQLKTIRQTWELSLSSRLAHWWLLVLEPVQLLFTWTQRVHPLSIKEGQAIVALPSVIPSLTSKPLAYSQANRTTMPR